MIGELVITLLVKILAWFSAVIIVGLNAKVVVGTIGDWIAGARSNAVWLWVSVVPIAIGCGLLLLYISVPESWWRRRKLAPRAAAPVVLKEEKYSRIVVALDYGRIDEKVLSHARTIAHHQDVMIFLFHFGEGV